MLASDVSIVIRVRNSAEHLTKAVATVRATASGAEVVIVDNGSTDTTAAIAASLGDFAITVQGAVGDCLRPGVERATKRAVFFMDADQRLLPGTVDAACASLQNCEAVVVPERPTVANSLWGSVLATERMWAEVSGLGRPRVFWREAYLHYKEPAGISFGEDRMIAAQVVRVAISAIPILHEEPASMAQLLRKYHRYGRRQGSARGTVDTLHRAFWSYLVGSTKLPMRSFSLLPLVGALKIAKAGAFYAGVLRPIQPVTN
jgi:hypothetical protein